MPSQYWKAGPAPEEVRRLRHALADYAVVHAFPDREEGTITVMATVNGDEMTVRVVDDGVGMRVRMDSPGAGLGLAIAGRVADRMVVEHPSHGGTEVRMTFAAAA